MGKISVFAEKSRDNSHRRQLELFNFNSVLNKLGLGKVTILILYKLVNLFNSFQTISIGFRFGRIIVLMKNYDELNEAEYLKSSDFCLGIRDSKFVNNSLIRTISLEKYIQKFIKPVRRNPSMLEQFL
ncbi:hypothetical protein BpHYR1_026963 [Brachionus plicatilis]|uniref:Uncharacterized protein n=1 Tax=Brachionus plicatilis TaxID=10195 RepID=A0A3M7QI05_BRAPC|nr:hypothetical protein BpHYR1_026963 [Brachionus plicatilis]